MRLINTRTLQLGEDAPEPGGGYAIFSHKWGLEEVTFQDMTQLDESTLRDKAGYAKVENVCRIARGMGLQHVWIDTCCIDKTRSAEVSQCLNAMFRWYKKSAVCIVYLHDFRPDPGLELGQGLVDSLAKCQWFQRAWTLQELIAPEYVRFFDHEWKFYGSKFNDKKRVARDSEDPEALLADLYAITHIPIPVLRDPDTVWSYPVGNRMSWAAHRRALYVEDLAYSLIGIFNVAESATRGRNVRQLRFDLGKFACAADLTAAFYSIRDCAASPEAPIPLVYFDGFDTSLPCSTSPFGWLPHLAPAMLDGVFSDGGAAKHMGRRAVFFFGASAVRTYADLKRRADANTDASARVRSFLGCLHGCVDVLGPNRIDAADRLYPVRRAALLRALLEEREPKLKAGEKLRIDHGVLNGLLLVPSYPQGVRSIRSIIAMSRLDGCQRFEFAALPPRTQLNIHVDYDELLRHMSGIPIPREHREEMARGIHNAYNDSVDAMPAGTPNKPSAEPWEALDEEKKESSRAHVDSIPHKLRLVGCFLSPERDDRVSVESFTPEDVDRMAVEEHDRWCSERLQKQWRLGPRDPKVRSSPFFVSWSELDKPWQDVDRDIVKRYPEILKPHGLMIYKVG